MSINISYKLEDKDYKNYNFDALKIKRITFVILKINLPVNVLFSIIFAIYATLKLLGGLYYAYWLTYALFAALFVSIFITNALAALLIASIFGGQAITQQLKGLDRNIELNINESLVSGKQGDLESKYPWTSIKDIYNTKTNLLIFVSDMQAIIIPKRIFKSKEEVDEIWNELQTYYNNSRNNL